MTVQVVILAAGQSKRMHSNLPKVLHRLGGKPLLQHVIDKALALTDDSLPVIVHGHQGSLIQNAFSHDSVRFVEQKEQLGTGHALLQALPECLSDRVLVLYGDVPLINESTLKKLLQETPANGLGMITAQLPNPKGYGRIKRNAANQIIGVVEEKDADQNERQLTEINSGIYFIPTAYLKKWLPKIENKNAQGEYYLTDLISFVAQENISIHAVQPENFAEILGVNDRSQLATLERIYQRQCAEKLLQQGVTLYDPNRFDLRGELIVGRDVTIDINVILEGRVVIGDGCSIGANVILRNVELGQNVEVKANSILDGAEIKSQCIIGPFARIRPGTQLAKEVHIGNFVEIKNSFIDEKSKVNHLSYIGDSEIGKRVNIGAGTITCNYDGVNKHKTIIADDVHIGSDTQLIAPIVVGEGATIGAGSTLTKDVPPRQLTVTHTLNQRDLREKR